LAEEFERQKGRHNRRGGGGGKPYLLRKSNPGQKEGNSSIQISSSRGEGTNERGKRRSIINKDSLKLTKCLIRNFQTAQGT